MLNNKGKPHMRYILSRKEGIKLVRLSIEDHKAVKYCADKDGKSMVAMFHELLLLGLKCKLENHVARLRRLGIDV